MQRYVKNYNNLKNTSLPKPNVYIVQISVHLLRKLSKFTRLIIHYKF
jgi:hypothetical protein